MLKYTAKVIVIKTVQWYWHVFQAQVPGPTSAQLSTTRTCPFTATVVTITTARTILYKIAGRNSYCDMTTDGGGWLVILSRTGRKRAFNKPWKKYQKGFRVLDRDFWLGLDAMHSSIYWAKGGPAALERHGDISLITGSSKSLSDFYCTSTTRTAIVSLIRHWLLTGQLDPPSKFKYAKLRRNCLEGLKSLKDLYQDNWWMGERKTTGVLADSTTSHVGWKYRPLLPRYKHSLHQMAVAVVVMSVESIKIIVLWLCVCQSGCQLWSVWYENLQSFWSHSLFKVISLAVMLAGNGKPLLKIKEN